MYVTEGENNNEKNKKSKLDSQTNHTILNEHTNIGKKKTNI